MKAAIYTLLAETPVHVGSHASEGIVDLPVARESVTGFPYIPGSGLKGALKQYFQSLEQNGDGFSEKLFGRLDSAGAILVCDARLLLLPVRSLNWAAMWVTCPHVVERLARDWSRAGMPVALGALPISDGKYRGPSTGDELPLILEEREFEAIGPAPPELLEAFVALVPGNAHENTRARLKERTALISDGDFAWFARNAIPINARNVLDGETKISKNLWYEEALAPDSLLYTVIAERTDGALEDLARVLGQQCFIQVGGNETVGMGWMTMRRLNPGVDE